VYRAGLDCPHCCARPGKRQPKERHDLWCCDHCWETKLSYHYWVCGFWMRSGRTTTFDVERFGPNNGTVPERVHPLGWVT
jgi:hypothetical protein